MPWEVTISSPHGEPLGDRDAVVKRISTAVPNIMWIEEPPLLERIKDMPDHPFHALIPTWPEETRTSFSRAKLLAELDAEDLSIQLYGFETQPIASLNVEVRGAGNPVPALAALCIPNGWIAIECAHGTLVDLRSNAASGWEAFGEYRDRAIGSIRQALGD
jgi:hypothetical protein